MCSFHIFFLSFIINMVSFHYGELLICCIFIIFCVVNNGVHSFRQLDTARLISFHRLHPPNAQLVSKCSNRCGLEIVVGTRIKDSTYQWNRRNILLALSIPSSSSSSISLEESIPPSPNSYAATFHRNAQNILTLTNLILWYLISAYYNIYNKRALTELPLPWTVAALQMGTGMLIFSPLWMLKLRCSPAESVAEWTSLAKDLSLVSLFTTLSHIAGVVSLGLGSVSFVQVVKAAEPLFTALISFIWGTGSLSWLSYLAMIPIIVGVSIASVNELHFSWICLMTGTMSNIFAGARSVVSKRQLHQTDSNRGNRSDQLSTANYYSIVTILSFLFCLPCAFVFEGVPLLHLFRKIVTGSLSIEEKSGLWNTFLSGLMHYCYNEMSFRVLANMDPVSHALANTIKRVAVIGLSVLMFRTQISPAGKVGSSLAIAGAFLYSVVGKTRR